MQSNTTTDQQININIAAQRLVLRVGDTVLMDVAISTGANGAGELSGSECTPRGWHQIRAKIGGGCAANTVFRGHRPTGELSSPALNVAEPGRDWILTRILWLSGLESGKNRGGNVDTMRRFVYLHGTPDEVELGQPGSRGCVRMRNRDIIELFDRIPVGIRVLISES